MKRLKLIIIAVLLIFLIMPSNVIGAEVDYTVEENKSYTRIYGDNRYMTSIALADAYKQKLGVSRFDNIIVASGTEFADALGGSYLSYVKQAPILISSVKSTKTDSTIIQYILDNLSYYRTEYTGTVYILGGSAAVSDYMEFVLNSLDVKVKRISGNNRYLTNIEILKEAGVKNEEIIVATGKDFADSLSASAVKRPILLVKDKLNASQLDYLKTLSSKKFYVVGGENAVNNDIVKQLSQFGSVERIAGSTRYETSVQIARKFFDHPEQAVVAYGQNYPDGLCGGPLATALNSPIILTRNGKSSSFAESYTAENGIASGYVLGGNTLISDATAKLIFPERPVAKAYAVLKNNGDFVFFRSFEEYTSEETGTFRDTEGRTYEGVIFGDFEDGTGETEPSWFYQEIWDKYTIQMKKVYVAEDYVIHPHSMYCWFLNARNISSFDFSGFDTKYMDNLSCTFENNISVTELDLSMFDTRNIEDMNMAFFNCSSLKELDLSCFETPELTYLDYAFSNCTSLEKLDISSLNTANIDSMNEMFIGTNLKEIKLGKEFTVWIDRAYLPSGNWTNGDLILSEETLYYEYPYNSEEWAGVWRFTTEHSPDEPKYAYAVLQENGDLVFIQSYEQDISEKTTVKDINDKEYTGYVFSNVENGSFRWTDYPYYSKVKRAYVAEGQTIVLKTANNMFKGCSVMKEADMTGFDTSAVEFASSMFENCYNLVSVNLTGMDTSSMKDMSEMFYRCAKLETLDISSFDTSAVTDMTRMFAHCNNLKKIALGPEFTKWINDAWLGGNRINKWKNSEIGITLSSEELYKRYPANASKWAGTWEKQPLNITLYDYAVLQDNGDLIYFNSETVYSEGDGQTVSDINGNTYQGTVFVVDDSGIELYRNFYNIQNDYCNYVCRVYVADGQTIHYTYLRGEYAHCDQLTYFDATGFDTSELYTTSDMFYGCSSLTKLDLTNIDMSKVSSMKGMFLYCTSLYELNISNFDTGNVNDMTDTFAATYNLGELDLRSFDTSKVTQMIRTFNACRAQAILLPDGFISSSVTTMEDMFYGAENVRELNLKGSDTSNVTNMSRLFDSCESIRELDLSDFDVRKAGIAFMFASCRSLTKVNISNFDTSNIDGVSGLFLGCSSLEEVDISCLKPKNFQYCHQMFQGCSSLKTIYASKDFSLDSVEITSGHKMFLGCENLVGGNGTAYDEEHTDYTYARIDKTGDPGYFTAKP